MPANLYGHDDLPGGATPGSRGPAPATPGVRGPTTPGTGRPGAGPTRRGAPITASRGPTSLDRLRIDWDYPVPARSGGNGTVAAPPLDLAAAIAAIAGDDPRPLLVLRDCLACQGRDHAVLRRDRDNDRTFLLARWFHCVKLPANVTGSSHPFRALFADSPRAHVFMCRADGAARQDLDGGRSQPQLWRAMSAMLREAYADDVAMRTRDLLALLDQFDRVDAALVQSQTAFDREIEANGAATARARKLAERLERANAERLALLERERRLLAAAPIEPAPASTGGGSR